MFKKLKFNVKMPHVNKKPLARRKNSVQTKKLGLERTMNALGKQFKEKTLIQKIERQ